jgi:hypothetical protein
MGITRSSSDKGMSRTACAAASPMNSTVLEKGMKKRVFKGLAQDDLFMRHTPLGTIASASIENDHLGGPSKSVECPSPRYAYTINRYILSWSVVDGVDEDVQYVHHLGDGHAKSRR